MDTKRLKQIFENKFSCWADLDTVKQRMAMDLERFVEVAKHITDHEKINCTLEDLREIFENNYNCMTEVVGSMEQEIAMDCERFIAVMQSLLEQAYERQ